jgi:large subunit ribosomal protein L6
MSRVGKNPITIPKGVEVTINDDRIVAVKGHRGTLEMTLPPSVTLTREDNALKIIPTAKAAEHRAIWGTTRALINNMVIGVSHGFERRLQLVGVGYRAQVQGKVLTLNLGFSHPISFTVPSGVTVETSSQTDVVVKGIDKQQVGQVAAKIRGYRPPEPYKGKGIRYADETIIIKEAKKK